MFVKEAFRLLQKSIIRVEQDDVEIEDPIGSSNVLSSAEALEGMQRLQISESDSTPATATDGADNMQVEEGSSAEPTRQRIRIDYEKFVQIKLMLAHKLRSIQSTEGKYQE